MKNSSKNAFIKNKILEKTLFVIGYFNLFIFGLGTIAYFVNPNLYDQTKQLLVFLMLDMIWIMMVVLGFKRNKLVRRYEQYASIVGDNDSFSISRLSTITGESETSVIKNLNLMIKRKFIKYGYFDAETNCIIFHEMIKKQPAVNTVSPQKKSVKDIIITCKHCGGMNKMKKGSIKACDYCKSLLEGN